MFGRKRSCSSVCEVVLEKVVCDGGTYIVLVVEEFLLRFRQPRDGHVVESGIASLPHVFRELKLQSLIQLILGNRRLQRDAGTALVLPRLGLARELLLGVGRCFAFVKFAAFDEELLTDPVCIAFEENGVDE